MVYSFPKYAEKLSTGNTQFNLALDKLNFQEQVVNSLLNSLIAHDPKFLENFSPSKARKIWEVAAILAEERNYRLPKT
jgi:hypothetical protein